MPPKKRVKGRAARELDEHGNEIIEEEEFPQYNNGTWINFPILRDRLAALQREQDQTAAQLPALIRRHTELLEAGNEDELERWRAEEGRPVTQDARRIASTLWMNAQADLEDFLFYQNSSHRWKRMQGEKNAKQLKKERLDKSKREELPLKTPVNKGPFLFPHGENPTLKKLLNRYDKLEFGTAKHRNGQIDASGKPKEEEEDREENEEDDHEEIGDGHGQKKGEEDSSPKLVGPRELRLWTPLPRRPPVGLRHEELEEAPYDLDLDLEAIEEKRTKIEYKYDTHRYAIGQKVVYKTHAERRKAELERYYDFSQPDLSESKVHAKQRPDGSSIFVKDTPDGRVTEDRYRSIQTDQGLFIAALESSYDWRTSYDFLGWVKSGAHMDFKVSSEREVFNKPLSEDEDEGRKAEAGRSDDIPDPLEEVLEDKEPEQLELKLNGRATEKRKRKNATTPAAKKLTAEEPAAEKPATRKKKLKVPMDESLKTVTANLDYPYEANEFAGPSKRLKFCIEGHKRRDPPESTNWAEETDGRREWHVNMHHTTVSPVDSPPHSPINFDAVKTTTIPGGFSDVDINPIETVKRRCRHYPERCRAWWSHPPDECWIVQSEQVPRPESPIQHPFMNIEAPEDFRLPDSGRKIYDGRVINHYGQHSVGDAIWPRVGVRVPYEPMTFDDLRLKRTRNEENHANETDGKEANILATDAKDRAAFEIHSLTVPVIPMSPRDYGGGHPSSDDNNDSESESDIEHDEFHRSYQEGSTSLVIADPERDTD